LAFIIRISLTCQLRVYIVLVVRSCLLRDKYSDTVYVIVSSGHTNTHYKLNRRQFRLACIAVLLIFFMHENKLNSFGLFALRCCVNKTNIRCWPNVRPSSNSHVCRMPYNTCT